MFHQIKSLLECANWLHSQPFPRWMKISPRTGTQSISLVPPPSFLLLSLTDIMVSLRDLGRICISPSPSQTHGIFFFICRKEWGKPQGECCFILAWGRLFESETVSLEMHLVYSSEAEFPASHQEQSIFFTSIQKDSYLYGGTENEALVPCCRFISHPGKTTAHIGFSPPGSN